MYAHTRRELIRDIEALGILPDDLVTIHISLKAVGPIDPEDTTGAHVMISALRYCVRDGLLLIPSHTYANIRDVPVYDVRRSEPCIGTVPRVAVELANVAYDSGDPTVIRSLHPDHSVVAFGRDAVPYTADDARSETPMPEFGSYRKLERYGGKILLIGVGLTNNTFIHAVDEYVRPWELSAPYPVTVIDYEGNRTPRITCNCHGPSSKYEKYRPCLTEAGALTFGKIGDADVVVCDAKKTFRTIAEHFDELNP